MTGVHIARATLRRTEDGYEGPVAMWSMMYTARIRRVGDAVELDLFDLIKPAPGCEITAIDSVGGLSDEP